MMSTAVKVLLRRRRVLQFPSCLRRFSSEPQQHDESVAGQAVELLQPPHEEWKLDQLRPLLFSEPPPSPPTFFHITRRLSDAAKALQFLHAISPSADVDSLAFSYQAVYEFAIRDLGSPHKVLDLYMHSKDRNIPLTVNAATLLIRCFADAGMRDESLSVFADLHPSLRNTHVCNALILSMFRCGRVGDALKVLDGMLQLDSEFPVNEATGGIVFPTLLYKMEGSGRVVNQEDIVVLVFKFFEHGVLPDSRTLCELITQLCIAGNIDWAWDVMHDAVKLGCRVHVACCNSILVGLGRKGDHKRVSVFLEKMKEMGIKPNFRTFHILINMLCVSRMVDNALELFEKIRQGEGGISVKPDVIMYNSLIYGLCIVGRPGEGLNMLEQMRFQDGCAPNHATYNSLVGGFCRAGEIERVHELLDEMTSEGLQPDVGTLNAAVVGMCKHGIPDSALKFINEMQCNNGLKGDAFTYATLIEAYCKVDDIDKGIELFERMGNDGHSPDVSVYYTLISGLSKTGRMDDAIKMASKLKVAGFRLDIACFNALISGFCIEDKVASAMNLLKEMEEADVKPNYYTYNTLMSYFTKTETITAAQKVVMHKIRASL